MSDTFVEVTWHDAFAFRDRWLEDSEIDEEPMVVRSVGWLLPDRKPNYVTLVQSINSDDIMDGLLFIPCAMVKQIRVVSGLDTVPFSRISA